MSRFIRLLLVCILGACITAARAVDMTPLPDPVDAPPISWHHTAWTAKDGAPSIILRMAQAPDGWLWLATTTGLYRFDGDRFERYTPAEGKLANQYIKGISILPSGDIWLTYTAPGLDLLRNGKVRRYGPADGIKGQVRDVVGDDQGTVWAATDSGVYHLQNDRWHAVSDGLDTRPDDAYNPGALHFDRHGDLWAISNYNAFVLRRGASHFERLAQEFSIIGDIVEAPDGALWALGGRKFQVEKVSDAPAGPQRQPTPTVHSHLMTFDRDGMRWMIRRNGVERWNPRTGSSEMLNQQQGLSGLLTTSTLLDREGNLWVSTKNGLDRFRNPRLTPQNLPKPVHGDSTPVAAGDAGSLWTDGYMLPGVGQPARMIGSMPSDDIRNLSVLYRDCDGVIWAAGYLGVSYLENGKFVPLALPYPKEESGLIYSVLKETNGNLWIASSQQGVHRRRNGVWQHMVQFPDVAGEPALNISADQQSRVWFGYSGNRLAMRDHDQLRLYDSKDGIDIGAVKQVQVRGKVIWIGGHKGLAWSTGGRFTSVRTEDEVALAGISGMLFGRDGHLWINGSAGISRIAPAELEKARADAGHLLRFERFDHRDGLQGVAPQRLSLPSVVEATDGRLWFSASNGISSIDPLHIAHNPLPPPVQIRNLRALGKVYAPVDGHVLPQGTEELQIDYTALSLTMPERMAFRYRLDGVDRDWKDAGLRRSAFYTNLKPGKYRFQVQAANNDGVWNTGGATISFEIQPTFVQTTWFRLLCGVLVLGVLLLLHRLRLHQAARRIQARLDERLNERERIARELHDTLLQSVQGLIVNVHAIALSIPEEQPLRQRMDRTLRHANDALVEGRTRVQDLRRAGGELFSMNDLLKMSLQEIDNGSARFSFVSSGVPRPMHPIVQEELNIIAREALLNARNHASASRIKLTIDYTDVGLTLTVSDDGVGLPEAIKHKGSRDGHWGLQGMRERSRNIKASFALDSAAGGGTACTIRLAAKFAYRERGLRLWRRAA